MIRSGTLISRAGVRLQPPWLKQDGRQAPRSIRIASRSSNSVRLPSVRDDKGDYLTGSEVCDSESVDNFQGRVLLGIVRGFDSNLGFSPWGI